MNRKKIDETQIDRLNDLVVRLFGERPKLTVFDGVSPPFDISQPNIHESKKEFLRELDVVESNIGRLQGIVDGLRGPKTEKEAREKLYNRLSAAIDKVARQKRKSGKVEDAQALAFRNLVDTGFFVGSFQVMFELKYAYEQRLKELKDQEKEFWSAPNRAPNYYARTIALRFARYYAKRKEARPTFGISSQGSHPSTEFGRALEEVFSILEIHANLRNVASWALEQLTEKDWAPEKNSLSALLPLGALPDKKPAKEYDDAMKAIIASMLPRKGQ